MEIRHLVAASLAFASGASAEKPTSSHLSALMRCRTIADTAQRATCYDVEAAALQSAVERKDIIIVDRGDVQRTQRSLFGITAPHVQLFDRLGSPDVQQLDTVVTGVSSASDGSLTFTVTDGAVWQQTDDYMLSGIKSGRKVTIKHGALGSFFATFDKGGSVRVKRLR